MSLSALVEGERKLLCLLGVNAGLGAARWYQFWSHLMPTLPSVLTSVQILVALATLVYMLLKIRRIVKDKPE